MSRAFLLIFSLACSLVPNPLAMVGIVWEFDSADALVLQPAFITQIVNAAICIATENQENSQTSFPF